jgi:hypothetical protein
MRCKLNKTHEHPNLTILFNLPLIPNLTVYSMCTVRISPGTLSRQRYFLYRSSESLLLAEAFPLFCSKSPIKFNFYPLAAMDFVHHAQKLQGVEGEFVAAHGTKAVRADAVLDLKQADPQEMLERAPDSGFSANPGISHEAAIADRRLAGVGVGEGVEDN